MNKDLFVINKGCNDMCYKNTSNRCFKKFVLPFDTYVLKGIVQWILETVWLLAGFVRRHTRTTLICLCKLFWAFFLTIPYHTIPYHTIQYNTIQYNTIQYNTIQYNTIQYNTIQYNTINTIQYNTTVPCNVTQCHTIQNITMQHNTIHM